jgi:hypothetical protein
MTRLVAHVRHNVIAYLALFVALGGTSYAAISLPRNSVGTPQLRNGAITPAKINGREIGGTVRAWAIVGAGAKLIAGNPRPSVGNSGLGPGSYSVVWPSRFARDCATVGTVDDRSPVTERVPVSGVASQPVIAGYVSQVETSPYGKKQSSTTVVTFDQAGQVTPLGFDVAVIC